MHCHWFHSPILTRRQMLTRCAQGFGAVALEAMLSQTALAARGPWAARPGHHPATAKAVIFIYLDGGPSQVDTFDYKPMLEKQDGVDARRAMGKVEPTQFNDIGKVMRSPWKFRQHGESGAWISDLLPHLAKHADKLCFVKSMTSKFSEHTFANYFLHTGHGIPGRPSMGAWLGYGLGTENQQLPGFVVLNGGLIPPGGLDCFSSGFLPAAYQGSVFNMRGEAVANVRRIEATAERQRAKLALMGRLDAEASDRLGGDAEIEAAIENYETAFLMQTAVPELLDISNETESIQSSYGLDASFANTALFGKQCLLARRLVERGVRFVELTCPGGNGDRWDQHNNLKDGHTKNARTVDQPIAALLEDLEQRGMLDSTLVVWAGEFGRTPFAQGRNGRDHNPFGFTVWMAGGGVRAGTSYGATDAFGYRAIENRCEIHDLHATMLHLLGLDHTRSTFRFSSREMRLTDVHGNVLHEIVNG